MPDVSKADSPLVKPNTVEAYRNSRPPVYRVKIPTVSKVEDFFDTVLKRVRLAAFRGAALEVWTRCGDEEIARTWYYRWKPYCDKSLNIDGTVVVFKLQHKQALALADPGDKTAPTLPHPRRIPGGIPVHVKRASMRAKSMTPGGVIVDPKGRE